MKKPQGERSEALSARLHTLVNHGHVAAWQRQGGRWRIQYNDGTTSEWREVAQMETFVLDLERGFGIA